MTTSNISDKTIVSKRISLQPPPRRPAKDQMRLNGIQRQTVRVAVATGATIAAIVGAQTLALLDRSAIVKPIVLGNAPNNGAIDPTVDPNAAAAANGSTTPATTPTALAAVTATKPKPSLNLNDNATATPVPKVGATRKAPVAGKTPQAISGSKSQPYPLSLSS